MPDAAMILLRDSSILPAERSGAVMALGNFDGLHLGHRAVISHAVDTAKKAGKPAAVMTFEPHPRRVFRPELPPLRLLPVAEKMRLLAAMGIDFLRVVRFTRGFAETTASDFVTRILHEQLHVSHVITGEDFVFGHDRGGNAASLEAMAGKLGFTATACPAVEMDGARISSTRIRDALSKGDTELAARMLGRPYTLSGPVRHGDKRGRVLGFPTANMLPSPLFLPAFGVYAVRARIKGKQVKGVANLGVRPQFPLGWPLLEVYLFDWSEEIYGERMEVELVRYLRPEEKFDGLEALKRRMAQDVQEARELLG